MNSPRLIQIDGKTKVLPSFTRVLAYGQLYLLQPAQLREAVTESEAVKLEAAIATYVTEQGLEPVTFEEADRQADWELILATLHWDKPETRTINLSLDQEAAVRVLGDGYGKMTAKELAERELLWDWSHVRDSSEFAVRAMANKIREIVAGR